MTPTSKILGALVLLALIGTAAFVLATSDDGPAQAIPVAGSGSRGRATNSAGELASPSATTEAKEAIKARAPVVTVV